jgi:hypothetical protein
MTDYLLLFKSFSKVYKLSTLVRTKLILQTVLVTLFVVATGRLFIPSSVLILSQAGRLYTSNPASQDPSSVSQSENQMLSFVYSLTMLLQGLTSRFVSSGKKTVWPFGITE